jgi:hypothetical protein
MALADVRKDATDAALLARAMHSRRHIVISV